MAIFKIINSKTTGHASLKGVLAYVIQESKTEPHIVSGIGDFIHDDEQLTAEQAYLEFYRIKKLFHKDSGRQYVHAVQSFAKNESNPEQVHEIGQKLATKLWPDNQVLVVTHIDKDHLHNHFIVNTVSYMDSRKIHWTKYDLERAKTINDNLCRIEGLSIPEKGFHQDGSKMKLEEHSVYSKNLYRALQHAKEGKAKSYVLECVKAVVKAIELAISKMDFIERLRKDGWETQWEDKRKYILFSDQYGNKVRNSRIEKLTDIDCSKEALLAQFSANEQENNVLILSNKAADIREQYVAIYCKRVQTEKKLDEIPIKYSKQTIQKLENLQKRLGIKDRQIQSHIQKKNELQSRYEQISGYHLIKKERLKNQIKAEQQAVDQLKEENRLIIRNSGFSSRDEIDNAIVESQQEQDAIASQKKLLETLKDEQESLTLSYQELLVRIPERKMITKRKIADNPAAMQAEAMLNNLEKDFYQVNNTEKITYHI